MKLLPDIHIYGHTVSLQDPFIIDGYIVTDIVVNIDDCLNPYENENRMIRFYSGDFCYGFNMYNFWKKSIKIIEQNYYFYNSSGSCYIEYEDDHGFHLKQSDDIDNNFYSWIIERFLYYHESNLGSIQNITDRLQRQGRIIGSSLYISENRYKIDYPGVNEYGIIIYNPVIDTENTNNLRLQTEESVSTRFRTLEDVGYLSGVNFNDFLNVENAKSKKIKNYIHPYNYIPEQYIKHYMNNENPTTTLLLGVEIEVGGLERDIDEKIKNSVVMKCIQIMNRSDSDKEDLIYSTHDGTVQIELDTMPCSLEFHKQKMNYKEMFEYLDKMGYKGHDCETAGLHIHANRDYLGKTKLQQQLVISKILYIIEKFNDEICVIGRRNTEYSKFVGDRAKEDTALSLFSKYTEEGKKAALNLMHKDTIEFRMFKSTLKYETFILTLEFVKDIIDFAKCTDIEEIELITWGNLMRTFSDELQKYYNDRYNKMLDKDIDKKIKHLKKLIVSKKNELPKAKNYLVKTMINKELSKLQTELRKCEMKRNKTVAKKNKEGYINIYNYYNSATMPTHAIVTRPFICI